MDGSIPYSPSFGSLRSFNLDQGLSMSGRTMIDTLQKLQGGTRFNRRKKKRFTYTNEATHDIQNSYKTGRHQYYFSRRILKNKRSKKRFFRHRTQKNPSQKFSR